MRSSPNDHPRAPRTLLAAGAVVGLSIVVGGGCNRTNNVDQSVTNNTANNVSKIFGPEGGHLDGPGGAELDLPPGALNEMVEITIGEVVTGAPETPNGLSDPSTVFAFLPHGQTFALDVTISVPHLGGPNANVVVFRADPGGEFEELALEATTDSIATVRSPSFSYYGSALGDAVGSSSTTDGTTGTTTDGTTGTTTDGTGEPTTGPGGFIPNPDMGGDPTQECSIYDQDCLPDQKCMPYDSNRSGEWNSTGCFDVDPDAVGGGAPCSVVDSATSGMDNCELGFMCWHVNPDSGEGTCTEFCTGNPDSPFCEDSMTTCEIQFDDVVSLCLQSCNPVTQDCVVEGLACYFGTVPLCALDQSGAGGNEGDPCDALSDCSTGTQCTPASDLDACATASCCTPFCDVSLNDCSNGNLSCVPLFEEGTSPPGSEDYGVCALPA